MYLVTSDWHVYGQRCNWAHVIRVAEIAVDRKVEGIILAGDIVDIWRDKLANIQRDHTQNLVAFGTLTRDIHKFWIPGNHDGDTKQRVEILKWLSRCWNNNVECAAPMMAVGKWVIQHGHEFDWINYKGRPVAHAITWLANNMHKIPFLRKVNETKLSPERWVTPANVEELRLPIHNHVNEETAKKHLHRVYGHTHSAYELKGEDETGHSWQVLNTGSCDVDTSFSCVVFEPDGEGELITE